MGAEHPISRRPHDSARPQLEAIACADSVLCTICTIVLYVHTVCYSARTEAVSRVATHARARPVSLDAFTAASEARYLRTALSKAASRRPASLIGLGS